MTSYVKEMAAMIGSRYGGLDAESLVGKLFEIGVVDHTLCKVLAVRQFVAVEVKNGEGKVDAMWKAAEHFCCTYEYVRKCLYYYTDVNLE